MHRSGTSALTRVLSLHGFALPQDLLGGRVDNPKGFFESAGMVALDDRILAALGRSWDDARPLPALPAPLLKDFVAEAAGVLAKIVPPAQHFILKDPRLCRLLPVWLPALARFGATPRAIIPLRNPLEIAASLVARDGMAKRAALKLWLSHMVAAERDTRGLPRAFTRYADLLADWRGVLASLGIPVREDAAAETDAFLSSGLRHHAMAKDALEADAEVPRAVKRLAMALRGAASPDTVTAAFDAAGRSRLLGLPRDG